MFRGLVKFIRKNWFLISVTLIIILSIALRFYDYQDRWGLAYDQAHDALVARGAIEQLKIPLVGPFSSAGPFQTSGVWYWLVISGTLVAPSFITSAWVLITLLFVGYVALMIYLGVKLDGKGFGLLVGVLTAVSTAQITQSVNLTVTAPMAIISALSVLMMLRYIKKKNKWDLFFFAFLVGLAPTMHTQGYPLLLFLLITIIFTGIPSLKNFIFLFAGLALPFMPLIIFDLKNDFVNSTSMARYVMYDQYKISLDALGRRWTTYLGQFWPKCWAYIVGGHIILGYAFLVSVVGVGLYRFRKKDLSKEWIIMIVYFFINLFIIRYTRTPIFDSYLVMLHTFVLLFSAWVLYFIYKKFKVIGSFLIVLVLLLTIAQTVPATTNATNTTYDFAKKSSDQLILELPDKKFKMYDFKFLSAQQSFPVSLYLSADGKSSQDGYKIGMIRQDAKELKNFKKIAVYQNIVFVDLENLSEQEINKNWAPVDPSSIYSSTEEWYSK